MLYIISFTRFYIGLLLIPHRYDIAKEIILTFTNNIRFGLVPNGFADDNNRPLYNSADASLLLFEQINKLLVSCVVLCFFYTL